jgi:hypothetical protein
MRANRPSERPGESIGKSNQLAQEEVGHLRALLQDKDSEMAAEREAMAAERAEAQDAFKATLLQAFTEEMEKNAASTAELEAQLEAEMAKSSLALEEARTAALRAEEAAAAASSGSEQQAAALEDLQGRYEDMEREVRRLEGLVAEGLAALEESKATQVQAAREAEEALLLAQDWQRRAEKAEQEKQARAQDGSLSAAEAERLRDELQVALAGKEAAVKELESAAKIHAATTVALQQDLGRELEGVQGDVERLQAVLGGKDEEMAAQVAQAEAARAVAAELQVLQ